MINNTILSCSSFFQPGNAAILVELGTVCSRLSKHKDAEHWYRAAVRLDEASLPALVGLARCQLADPSSSSAAGDLAKQQIDYLAGMPSLGVVEPELLMLRAKLGFGEAALELLAKAAGILIRVY